MFAVLLSYKCYLLELICYACLRIQSSLGILPHSLWLRAKCRLLKLVGLAQLRLFILNLLDTLKAKKSLQNLAKSWELWRQAFRGANTRCRHHHGMKQLLEQDRLNIAGDALAASAGIGGQRRRLRIRDGP